MVQFVNNKREFICVAGKNDIAVSVLEYLLKKVSKDSIGVLCNKTETGKNSFQKSLRWFAQKYEVHEYTLQEVYEIDNLLLLSMEFDQIINPAKFKNARMFNIHFSMLPKYRGMYTSTIPILNGEKEVGVTLHRIDTGIDTGEIIDQQAFDIEGLDCREVYLKYIRYGINIVFRNINDVLAGREKSVPQPVKGATYYSRKSIDYKKVVIDLNQTAEGIKRQILAYRFREYQLPQINNHNIIDFEYTSIRSSKKPGTVILETEEGCEISTIDYNLILYYDRLEQLLTACQNGDICTVRNICSVKRHINERNQKGWTPLIVATYNNKIEIVNFLLLNGADIYNVNNNGTTILMYAKAAYKNSGDNTLFKLFISLGVPIDTCDYYGRDLDYYIKADNIQFEELNA